jgi:hypothetical protein
VADVDGDGREDFVLANQWESSTFYLNRSSNAGSFIGLHLMWPHELARADTVRVTPGHPRASDRLRPAVGATALLTLPDGRHALAQVDGGSGHSGKRSPEIHFGIGQTQPGARLPIQLQWRDAAGTVHRCDVDIAPGSWYTLQLGVS